MNVGKFHVGSLWSRRCPSRAAIQYGCAWLILVVVLSSLSAQEIKQPPPSSPRFEFESTEVDLGTIDRGEITTVRFTLRNVGDQPVRILRVKPG